MTMLFHIFIVSKLFSLLILFQFYLFHLFGRKTKMKKMQSFSQIWHHNKSPINKPIMEVKTMIKSRRQQFRWLLTLPLLLIVFAGFASAQAPSLVWAVGMGGPSGDQGHGIAVDAAGNVYTTGYFQGTTDFEPGAGVTNLTSAGSGDVFVQKLDPSGNLVWAVGRAAPATTRGSVSRSMRLATCTPRDSSRARLTSTRARA